MGDREMEKKARLRLRIRDRKGVEGKGRKGDWEHVYMGIRFLAGVT